MSTQQLDVKAVITKLGGNAKTAKLCGVTKGAVSQWLHNGIPKGHLNFLRLARPDAFKADRRAKVAQ
jgi:hypothetical protein